MENRWFVFWYGTDSDGSVICVDEVFLFGICDV